MVRLLKAIRPSWLFLGGSWLALLLGCVFRSRHLPMWVDELYSYTLIRDSSLAHMLAASGDQADGAPPLYYLLARPWAALFSLNEVSLRLFSSVCFCAAIGVLWRMLRRAFTFWPAAVSLATVFGTSHIIRFENANVRFYGLLLALISLATLLTVKLGEREQPDWRLLAANVLTQAALVLCHPLGGFYGAMLGVALCVGDRLILRRWRWRVALTYPLGWLALLLWARQLLHQAGVNQPHSWVPVPQFREIAGVLYGGSDFYPLFLLFTLLAAWRVFTLYGRTPDAVPQGVRAPPIPSAIIAFSDSQCRQLLIACALICLPLLWWVLAQIVPSNPLFLARYVIGVSVAWAILLAQLLTVLLPAITRRGDGWTTAILAGFIVLQFGPFLTEPPEDRGALTGETDPAFGHVELPIVCPRSHDFLPREYYSPLAERYYFLLDWEVAAAPENSRHATVEYKVLDALRRNYDSLFHHHIVQADEFLRTHPVFLVHEVPHTSWVAMRLKPEEYTITRLQPDRPLDYARDGVWPMLLIERKEGPGSGSQDKDHLH